MKTTTIEKIIRNGHYNTVIGRYTYRFDAFRRAIIRCKTEDIGRAWIDSDGNQYDGWETVWTEA